MPIKTYGNLKRISQKEFSAISYEVMNHAFLIHDELESLFDESVYKNALAAQLSNMETEMRIDVSFHDFCKSYYMDAVVSPGAIFELKSVKNITAQHRRQLLNYLLLADLAHGKLINFGAQQVQHEFVNTTLTCA